MTFTTVFDARTHQHASASFLFLLMIPIAIFFFARRDLLRLPAWASLVVTALLLIGAFVVPSVAFFADYLQRRSVDDAVGQARMAVAEGPVISLVRTTRRSRVWGQSFTVGDHRFAYACDVTSPPAFRDCGDLIQNGRMVRITYAGDLILRVEVAP